MGGWEVWGWAKVRRKYIANAAAFRADLGHNKGMFNSQPTLIQAGAVMDGAGVLARPGVVAVSAEGWVVYAGPPAGVPAAFLADSVAQIRLPDRLVVPGFVNAHTHLELTGIGPRPYDGDFPGWLEQVVREKPATDAAWWASYEAGLAASAMAGTVAAGDIVAHDKVKEALQARFKWEIWGMAYAEQFGLGAVCRIPQGYELFSEKRIGIQPHAPYSAGPLLFETASQSGFPLSTHLAETTEELEFVARGTGPFRELLEKLGKWKPQYAAAYQAGLTPVEWMRPHLAAAHWLLAHVNYASDADLVILARTGTSVAYCPVASDYFGHKNHRYRDMLAYGINVCLGTDSAICQPASEPHPLGVLPQMRHLFLRDATDPLLLLKMATVNGAKALGLAEDFATFKVGAEARPVALTFDPENPESPLAQALRRSEPAEPLFPHLP